MPIETNPPTAQSNNVAKKIYDNVGNLIHNLFEKGPGATRGTSALTGAIVLGLATDAAGRKIGNTTPIGAILGATVGAGMGYGFKRLDEINQLHHIEHALPFLEKLSYLREAKDGWHVMSEKGKHLGGPYSHDQAVKRLRQIEYFKHHKTAAFNDELQKIIKEK